MNLNITEKWLREKTATENDHSISAGAGFPLRKQIEDAHAGEASKGPGPERASGFAYVDCGSAPQEAGRSVTLTVLEKRQELRAFMSSSTEALAMAARNFEELTDTDVDIMYEQVELLKKMAAGAER